MGKEITFDKFIRWAGVTLIVLAVLYMMMITHNNEIAQLADRIIRIEDGRISE